MNIRVVGIDETYILLNSDFNELEGVIFFADNKEIIEPDVTIENKIKEENLIIYKLKINNEEHEFKRTINEVTIAPFISGVFDTKIPIGSNFDLLNGIEAKDVFGNNLTEKITVRGKVDTSKPGLYPIIYNVCDSNGTETQVTRNVSVNEYKVVVSPMPQQFAPISVICDDNGTLEQVGDIKSNSEPNKITEVFQIIKPTKFIFLKYKNINNIQVVISPNKDVTYELKSNVLVFSNEINEVEVTITYMIRNSFSVSYGAGGDYMNINLNVEKEPSLVEVNYECDENSNKRQLEHLSFNSIYNTNFDGFIYIDKNNYEASVINIHISTKYLYSRIGDKCRFYIELLDTNSNPLPNKNVIVSCTSGECKKDFEATDLNGIIPVTYFAPNEQGDGTVQIKAIYEKIACTVDLIIKERNF